MRRNRPKSEITEGLRAQQLQHQGVSHALTAFLYDGAAYQEIDLLTIFDHAVFYAEKICVSSVDARRALTEYRKNRSDHYRFIENIESLYPISIWTLTDSLGRIAFVAFLRDRKHPGVVGIDTSVEGLSRAITDQGWILADGFETLMAMQMSQISSIAPPKSNRPQFVSMQKKQ